MDPRMAAAQPQRAMHWQRDASSPVTCEKSVAQNPDDLKAIVGLVSINACRRDRRLP
jgi:hypothetical protein